MFNRFSSIEDLTERLSMLNFLGQENNRISFGNNEYSVLFTVLSAGVIKLQIERMGYICEKVVDIRSFAEIDYSSKNFKEQLAEFLAKEIRFLNVSVVDFNGNYVCEVFFQVGKTRYLVNLLMRKLS